jgi:hypothetical protein
MKPNASSGCQSRVLGLSPLGATVLPGKTAENEGERQQGNKCSNRCRLGSPTRALGSIRPPRFGYPPRSSFTDNLLSRR